MGRMATRRWRKSDATPDINHRSAWLNERSVFGWMQHRDIAKVAAACNWYATDAWLILSSIPGVPHTAKIDLEPRVELIGAGFEDVAEVAVDRISFQCHRSTDVARPRDHEAGRMYFSIAHRAKCFAWRSNAARPSSPNFQSR